MTMRKCTTIAIWDNCLIVRLGSHETSIDSCIPVDQSWKELHTTTTVLHEPKCGDYTATSHDFGAEGNVSASRNSAIASHCRKDVGYVNVQNSKVWRSVTTIFSPSVILSGIFVTVSRARRMHHHLAQDLQWLLAFGDAFSRWLLLQNFPCNLTDRLVATRIPQACLSKPVRLANRNFAGRKFANMNSHILNWFSKRELGKLLRIKRRR